MEKFFAFTRLFLGWDWFVGAPQGHDGRRRTTKTLAMFTRFARGTALGNAGLLAVNYLAVANAALQFVPESLEFLFPTELDTAFAVGAVKSWFQSQLCIQSLSGIHSRLLRIAKADNG